MQNKLLRINFGDTNYFAKVLQHTKHGFAIDTVFPVEGIKYSETSSGDYDIVSYFEERVLHAFRKKLILEIELVLNRHILKEKLRELEFSLSIFLDDEFPTEKNERIKQIFGEAFFKDNFHFFEYTPSMVNYLIEYLEFSKMEMLTGKRLITVSQEAFLEGLKEKIIHSITNNKTP
ncbi:hypothetical protein [Kaistella antarctica]|nr:hypothetical protein [Kaistella antarctica]